MSLVDNPDKLARAIGALAGLCLAAALIAVARPASGHGGVLPARIGVSAHPDGAVAVTPASPIATRAMRPGDRAAGLLRLSNQTGRPLSVGLRAEPSRGGLDGIARLRIAFAGRRIADATIQGLRRGSGGRIRLAPGASAEARIVISIPAETETGYEGRRVRVALAPIEGRAR